MKKRMKWVGIKQSVSRLKNSASLNANVFADMETGRVFVSDAEGFTDTSELRCVWEYSGLRRNVPTMAELRAACEDKLGEWDYIQALACEEA